MFCHKSYTIGCPWFNIANSRIQTNIRIRYKKQYRSFTVVYVLINYLVVCKLCVVKLHLYLEPAWLFGIGRFFGLCKI
jgi:hypothetical protein